MKNCALIALVMGLFVLASGARGADIPAAVSTSSVAGPESLLVQADAAYARRDDLPQTKIALFYYEKAVLADTATVEACWKASRAAWWLGDHSPARAEKLGYFQKGIDFAKEGLARNPDSVESHFWLSANFGSYGEGRGILKSLFLIKPIRHEMAEVNRINDRFYGGGGYRVLGIVDYKLPGFAGGSKKRAFERLSKALAMDPNNPFNRYYMAEYYENVGDKEKAREELKTLDALAPEPDLEPELRMMQEKGKKLAEKL